MFEASLFALLTMGDVIVVVDGYDIETINDYGTDATGATVLMCESTEDNRWYFADQTVRVENGRCKVMTAPGDWDCGTEPYEADLEFFVRRPLLALDENHEPPTIVVEMDGGAIHNVTSSAPARVILLDADTEGSDEERIREVNEQEVYVHDHSFIAGRPGIDAEFVASVVDQIRPKNTCSECGAIVDSIIGCPDGSEVCQQCFDNGGH